jgi:lipopolysaccharide transport system ATP-binding protein
MNNLAIYVDRISKQYHIGQGKAAQYSTLRDQVSGFFHRNARNILKVGREKGGNSTSSQQELIWAVRDISFEVRRGEVVGIIGPNGAGKSTLLKILTQITEPTHGRVAIFGKVGSLLEVGTGFHKELTGRENVYLNGAILGMKKAEIDRKFEEIVSFSEFEKFIDTPMKYYSSGMQVRLAFAVAAHMEPDILLVDEVLAVGDAAFQKKCLNKMEEVGHEGRTVIFVSHHMPSITRLCVRAILLEQGRIVRDGPTHQVVAEYLHKMLGTTSARYWEDPQLAPSSEVVRLRSLVIKNASGQVVDTVDVREMVAVELGFEVLSPGYVLYPGFTIHNEEDIWLFASLETTPEWLRQPRPAGHYVSTGWIPGNLLAEGTMFIGASIRSEQPERVHFYEREAAAFRIIEKPGDLSARLDHPGQFPGVIRPLLKWETHFYPPGQEHP